MVKEKKEKKPKRGFMDCYNRSDRQYNPAEEGFGNPTEWRAAFYERMGWKEAVTIVGSENPLSILGLKGSPSSAEIKTAYRKLCQKWHPDKWQNASPAEYAKAEEMFKKINAAYVVLTKK